MLTEEEEEIMEGEAEEKKEDSLEEEVDIKDQDSMGEEEMIIEMKEDMAENMEEKDMSARKEFIQDT